MKNRIFQSPVCVCARLTQTRHTQRMCAETSIKMKKSVGIFMKLLRNEPTMYKAIESVLNQTYTNLRYYILVGSDTKSVVMQYAEKDTRIVVLDEKQGQSSVVNCCKKIVQDGNDYFSQIDGDDWYAPNYIEELVKYAEVYHTDITACGNYFVNNQEEIIGVRQQQSIYWDTKDTDHILPQVYAFFRTIWGKLIKSEVIMKFNPEQFPAQELYGGYGGDTIYMFSLLPFSGKVGITEKILYNYRVSPASSSYKLYKGRLDADVFLFKFVEEKLRLVGEISDRTENFLYIVYGEALTDTMRVLLNSRADEKEMADKLLHLFQNDVVRELLFREKNGQLLTKEKYAQRFYNMIFYQIDKKKMTEEIIEIYLNLFGIIFDKWMDKFSVAEFKIILKRKAMLDALVAEKTDVFFELLLDFLRESKREETEVCLNLLRRTSTSVALTPVFIDKRFVLTYREIIEAIIQEKPEEVFQLLLGYFLTDDFPYQSEQLVELWENYAAEVEATAEYIFAKELEVEICIKAGETDKARMKYEELRELKINDENMNTLYAYLY